MTDHPRFQIVHCSPEQCYRQYHGAALVTWVFSAAEWWLSRRSRRRFAAGASAPSINILSTLSIASGEYALMRRHVATTPTARACQIASLLLVLMMVLGMLAHDVMRNADVAPTAQAGGDNPVLLVAVP